MGRERDHLGNWEVVVQANDAGGWSRNETCGKEDCGFAWKVAIAFPTREEALWYAVIRSLGCMRMDEIPTL